MDKGNVSAFFPQFLCRLFRGVNHAPVIGRGFNALFFFHEADIGMFIHFGKKRFLLFVKIDTGNEAFVFKKLRNLQQN